MGTCTPATMARYFCALLLVLIGLQGVVSDYCSSLPPGQPDPSIRALLKGVEGLPDRAGPPDASAIPLLDTVTEKYNAIRTLWESNPSPSSVATAALANLGPIPTLLSSINKSLVVAAQTKNDTLALTTAHLAAVTVNETAQAAIHWSNVVGNLNSMAAQTSSLAVGAQNAIGRAIYNYNSTYVDAKKNGNKTLAQDAYRNMTLANSIQTMATPFLRALSPAKGAEARFDGDQVYVQYFETDMQAAADSVSDLISAIHTQSYYRFADCTTVAKGLSDGAIPHVVLFLQDLCSSYL